MTRYRLSPYCLFYFDAEVDSYVLVHTLIGSRFAVEGELFQALARFSAGAEDDEVATEEPGVAEVFAELVTEKVLLAEEEWRSLMSARPFRNRLDALELGVHRGFNEGGYFPERVDREARPPLWHPREAPDAVPLGGAARQETVELRALLRRRQSIRRFSDEPLALAKLAELLDVTCRNHAQVETPDLGWICFRAYPSGGARYPLEIYPLVARVEGLSPGLYHYCPFRHRLEPIPSSQEHRKLLLDAFCARLGDAVAPSGKPAVVLILTARVERTCWKYRGMSYQIILQETGALYQTLYLAATSLELAPCAIGAFPERATAEVLGLDARDEVQVGAFLIGEPVRSESAAALTIVDIRPARPEVGAICPDGRAIELVFGSGAIEVASVPLTLKIVGGVTRCLVFGGRYEATLTPRAEERLRDLGWVE